MDEKRVARFWAKVDKDGPVPQHVPSIGACWVWTGSRTLHGYGSFRVGPRRTMKAHRVSWCLHTDAPAPGLCVCHRCDNPSCVRPSHLFIGTRGENAQDMLSKGRGPCGERSRVNKLTAEDVKAIRVAPTTVKDRELATLFGVHYTTIGKVRRGRRWRHV